MENSSENHYPEFPLSNDDFDKDELSDEIDQLTRRKEVLDLVLGKLIDAIKDPPATTTHSK